MGLAGALLAILACLFVIDVVRDLPLVPLLLIFFALVVPSVACAWKPRIALLLLLSWIAAGVGIVWSRLDWRHDAMIVVVPATAQQDPGVALWARVPGTPRTSYLYPLLSLHDDTWEEEIVLRLEIRDPGAKVGYALSGATVTPDGGTSRPLTLPGVELGTPLRGRFGSGFVNVTHESGVRKEDARLTGEIRFPLQSFPLPCVVAWDLEIDLPTGRTRQRLVFRVERQHQAVLRMKAARL